MKSGLILFLSILCIALLVRVLGEPDLPFIPEGSRATRVVVEKGRRLMTLYQDEIPLAIYTIALGGTPSGDKQREGDRRTPEGEYLLDYRNLKSSFHLSMHISYPDSEDKATAKIVGDAPGGMIMIHGLRNGLGWIGEFHTIMDWTNGCIAITDQEIDQFCSVVADSTPIIILP